MSAPSATSAPRHPAYPVLVEVVPDCPEVGDEALWSTTLPCPGGIAVMPAFDVPCRVRVTDARGEVWE